MVGFSGFLDTASVEDQKMMKHKSKGGKELQASLETN